MLEITDVMNRHEHGQNIRRLPCIGMLNGHCQWEKFV